MPEQLECVAASAPCGLGLLCGRALVRFPLPDDVIAVYLPQSYNFAGQLIAVPRGRVQVLTDDASSMMAFIVSGGISGSTSR